VTDPVSNALGAAWTDPAKSNHVTGFTTRPPTLLLVSLNLLSRKPGE